MIQLIAAARWTDGEVPIPIHAHTLVLEFGLGCLICYLTHHGLRKYCKSALALSALFFLAGAMFATKGALMGWLRVETYGLGAAFLIYAVVTLEARDVAFPRYLVRLGDASYSLYIWHYLLIQLLATASESSGLIEILPLRLRPFLVLAWIAVIYLIGFASFYLLERPLLRLTRAFWAQASRRASSYLGESLSQKASEW